MQTPDKSLRILVMVNLPWDPRLGAVRVCMELAEQWRVSGHLVEQYSLSEAFGAAPSSSASLTLRQILFPFKAAAFVRKNGAKFDVIDGLIGVLPFSKTKLGFSGLMVGRSVGLYRLYDEFDRSSAKRWPGRHKGKLIGRIFYSLARRRSLGVSDRAVRHADLINLPNEEEATCLRREVAANLPILVQPYGLTEERRAAFRNRAAAPEVRLMQQRVCFIGMWGARKGARDWAEIIRRIRQAVPNVQFRFLGTMVDSSVIWQDLQLIRVKASISFHPINPRICQNCWRIAPSARFQVTPKVLGWECWSNWLLVFQPLLTPQPDRAICWMGRCEILWCRKATFTHSPIAFAESCN